MLRYRRTFCSASLALVQSVEKAASQFGMFGIGNVKADSSWKDFSLQLVSEVSESTSLADAGKILDILASHNVSIASVWASLFEQKLDAKLKSQKSKMSDLIALISSCNLVDFRSEVAINKLITALLDNETVWVISPDELVAVSQTIANSFTQNKILFAEIGNRVSLEIKDFNIAQIVKILDSFAKINLTSAEMIRVAAKRFVDEFDAIALEEKINIACIFSRLRFRSDTFFKLLVKQLLEQKGCTSNTCEDITAVLVAMQRLKMNLGTSDWWDRQSDYESLLRLAHQKLQPESINRMNARELSFLSQVVKNHGDDVMKRMQHLLTQEPLSRSHRHLAIIMEALSRKAEEGAVSVENLRWLAEWLCGNVFILSVHDIATINRSIAKLGFKDHHYHKIWIPYYLERLKDLSKDDVGLISDNYNAIGMSDTQMGGRHFFYKLGKRFQELTIDSGGDKELSERRKFRSLQRLG